MTAEWHVPGAHIAAYAAGSIPETDAWALEKHLEACTPCARRVSAAAAEGAAAADIAAVRAAVLEEVTGPAAAPAGQRRMLLAHAAGPALGRAWAVSLLMVAAGAVVLARLWDVGGARPLLLAAAPLLPVAGVAASYGRHGDPMYETVASTPGGGLRLLLTRAVASLTVCVMPLTAAGWLMPSSSGAPTAATWLLPSLALTLLTLLAGSFTDCARAAAGTTIGWLLMLAASATPSPDVGAMLSTALDLVLAGGRTQALWALAAVLLAALVALRRTSFDRLEQL